MTKKCFSCGATLPESACFCHVCATIQQERKDFVSYGISKTRNHIIWWIVSGILCLILVFTAVERFQEKEQDITESIVTSSSEVESESGLTLEEPQPQELEIPSEIKIESSEEILGNVYEGGAEVTYTDSDGSYHVFVTFSYNNIGLQKADSIWQVNISEGESFALPSQLAAYHSDTVLRSNGEFMEKVERVTVESIPGEFGKQMSVSVPDYDPSFPDAAMVSGVSIDSDCGTNGILWTIEMKNGDRIILEQTIYVIGNRSDNSTFPTTVFNAENAPVGNIDEVKALLNRIQTQIGNELQVTIELPPNYYIEDWELDQRNVNLYGTENNGQKTTFTGSLVVNTDVPEPMVIKGILFMGNGGTAIRANEPIVFEDCVFSGWDTAIEVGAEGIELINCKFYENTTDIYNPNGYSIIY